jgi:hypothetical protein
MIIGGEKEAREIVKYTIADPAVEHCHPRRQEHHHQNLGERERPGDSEQLLEMVGDHWEPRALSGAPR